MEFATFVRKPFTVEAVEVTTENIADLAPFIGTLKRKENGTPYIQVNRHLVPNVFQVFPGWWVTRVGDNVRCYARKVFADQFTKVTPTVASSLSKMGVEVSVA